ncbi:hypothetical protein CLV40_11149 [Actinokineospora auranticolor]|uniref:Uncharacterized protein n=1 Tax=Actinokineospora auranticolor TaxID=155976 RepID=A0A2S6GLI8_9PSEU|nr:hypothetical protein CLV40_11149 [Actinokineospora auranticolor]
MSARRDPGTIVVWALAVIGVTLIVVSVTLTIIGDADPNRREWTGTAVLSRIESDVTEPGWACLVGSVSALVR